MLQRGHGVLPRITASPCVMNFAELDRFNEAITGQEYGSDASTKPRRVAADNGPHREPVWNNDLRLRLREVSPSAGHQALIGQLDADSIEKIPKFLKSCILRALPGVIGTPAALANRRRPRLHHDRYAFPRLISLGCDLIGQTDVHQDDRVVMMVKV